MFFMQDKVATRFHVSIRSGLVSSGLRISWVKIFGFEKKNRIQDVKILVCAAQIFYNHICRATTIFETTNEQIICDTPAIHIPVRILKKRTVVRKMTHIGPILEDVWVFEREVNEK